MHPLTQPGTPTPLYRHTHHSISAFFPFPESPSPSQPYPILTQSIPYTLSPTFPPPHPSLKGSHTRTLIQLCHCHHHTQIDTHVSFQLVFLQIFLSIHRVKVHCYSALSKASPRPCQHIYNPRFTSFCNTPNPQRTQ